MNELLEMDVP